MFACCFKRIETSRWRRNPKGTAPLMRAHTAAETLYVCRKHEASLLLSISRSNKYFSSGTKRVRRSRKTRSQRDSRIILVSLKGHGTFLLPGDIFSDFTFRDGYVYTYVYLDVRTYRWTTQLRRSVLVFRLLTIPCRGIGLRISIVSIKNLS